MPLLYRGGTRLSNQRKEYYKLQLPSIERIQKQVTENVFTLSTRDFSTVYLVKCNVLNAKCC